MVEIELNGKWKMRKVNTAEWLDVAVPGSIMNDLLQAGKIEDPFYRDNEDQAKEIVASDYEYERDFLVDQAIFDNDQVVLDCEGLDTFAQIRINDREVGITKNMFRTYEWDVKPFLTPGNNVINITILSPLRYMAEKDQECSLYHATGSMAGYPYIRKAHYMFGWDWGPQIPDAGIWRALSIRGYRYAQIEDVYITQEHQEDRVDLDCRVRIRKWVAAAFGIAVNVITPEGRKLNADVLTVEAENHLKIAISNPQKWWPNGYGEHPLHRVEVLLKKGNEVLEERHLQIGLRTIGIKREKDQWGETFEFEVNGVSIFGMGADYIPEDNLLPRCTPQRTEKLIQSCVDANFNCIRVWGGGIYPDDYFFDLCDRYGLIVWQDLMFACAQYVADDDFLKNVKREAEDNIRRIRHHACLGLWCGNNELEWFWTGKSERFKVTSAKLKNYYVKQFEELLPGVAREIDPNTFYWPSSPSSGGWFEETNDPDKGDVHYWDVWHDLKPFEEYRNFYFRFVSEFGFQSFPCMKTIESFTLPEDRNIFSYVMERHQKNGAANGRILNYISDNFKYPKDLDSLVYASQILQGEAIKYGVEHWRRNRGQCMGAIYWQLNDCWPVASWASLDYYGRWKALHYFAKRFYAPVLISACEDGAKVNLHVNNDTLTGITGEIQWKLMNNQAIALQQGHANITVGPLKAKLCQQLDFSSILTDRAALMNCYLVYSLTVDGCQISSGTTLFVKPKHFEFREPGLQCTVRELDDSYVCAVTTKHLAKYVELEINDRDCQFSDNYFDLAAGETKEIVINKASLSSPLSVSELQQKIKARSIYDIA